MNVLIKKESTVFKEEQQELYAQVGYRFTLTLTELSSSDNTCVDGTLHLVGSDDVSRGRVEYCSNGTWYSLCADGWDTTGNEANVVCRTWGYQRYYDGKNIPF